MLLEGFAGAALYHPQAGRDSANLASYKGGEQHGGRIVQDTPLGERRDEPARAELAARIGRARRRAYEIVEGGRGTDRAAEIFDSFLVALILLNVAAFAAETVPSLEARYGLWFDAFEVISVGVFTVEYVVRIWTAVEVPFLKRRPPLQARLTWASRPYLLIDLLAILPFYLGQFFAIDLRVLRVLRLLRFLKLSRYSPALHTLIRVLNNERRALTAAGLLLMAAVLFASTGIYFLEQEAQPDKFGSVPESAWWAIATLTTVGYGDVTPITPFGRLFGGIMICGLCILALPVAIIATGFAQEMSRRDFVVTWSLMSRIPLLADLDAKEVAEIMPLFHAHNLPPRTEIIAHGAPYSAIYFVASGRVQLVAASGEELSFAVGEFFGATSILGNDVAAGSYRTVGHCRLLKLYKHDFHRLEAASPTLAGHIRRVALERQHAREAGHTAAK
ncbi:MAG TPA: cyclic nucleotide-gated ion channel [Hyphomicrobiaceae bacterium]|nr:cyclic nucleotide-gated ion channel [Hyphomicrobiaceae bacterium]